MATRRPHPGQTIHGRCPPPWFGEQGEANTFFHCFVWLTGHAVDQGNGLRPDENSHPSLHVTRLVLPYPPLVRICDQPAFTGQFPDVGGKIPCREVCTRRASPALS